MALSRSFGAAARRRARATAVVLLASALGVLAQQSGTPGAAAATAHTSTARLTVRPHRDLADGEIVKVHGSGFPARAQVGIAECKVHGPTGISDCDISTAQLLETSAAGTFTISYAVTRRISVNGPIDCAKPHACKLGAATYPDLSTAHASVGLQFNPHRRPIGPSVAASPTRSLASNTLVTVEGHGFLPRETVTVMQCATSRGCQYQTNQQYANTSSKGRLRLTYRPSRQIVVFGSAGEREVTCGRPVHCYLELQGASHLVDGERIPVTFAKGKRAVTPSSTLSQRRGLADGQVVTVDGSGLDPASAVQASECPLHGQLLSCQNFDFATSAATTAGTASLQLAVSRHLGSGTSAVDCAAVKCVVRLFEQTDFWYSSDVRITFDTALPKVIPSFDATPSTGLSSSELVSLGGSSWPAGATVVEAECTVSLSPSQCASYAGAYYGGATYVTADAAGSFDDGFLVSGTAEGSGATEVTCGTGANACQLVAVNENNSNEWARVPISFAPGALRREPGQLPVRRS